jgi:hypothetical protein
VPSTNNFFYSSAGNSTLGTTGVDGFVETISTVSLPLHLLSFQAEKTNEGRVRLNWSTSQEQEMNYFEVERSSDGITFNKSVGHVAAAGNNRDKMDYASYDFSPITGHNYYRLKMVDNRGAFTYSEVRDINFKDLSANSVLVVPNPANNSSIIQIKTDKDQTINYILANSVGQVIRTGKANVINGINNIALRLKGVPPGTYLLSVNGQSIMQNVKITKME